MEITITNKMLVDCANVALERVQTDKSTGMCDAVFCASCLLMTTGNEFLSYRLMVHVNKYKPQGAGFGYWFPTNEKGKQKRVHILKQVLTDVTQRNSF